jgi:hypothetical protein
MATKTNVDAPKEKANVSGMLRRVKEKPITTGFWSGVTLIGVSYSTLLVEAIRAGIHSIPTEQQIHGDPKTTLLMAGSCIAGMLLVTVAHELAQHGSNKVFEKYNQTAQSQK